jgi:hypothetical protein
MPEEKDEMVRKAPRLSKLKIPANKQERRFQIMEDVIDAFECTGELSHKDRQMAFQVLINYLYYDRNLTETQILLMTVNEFANAVGQWKNGVERIDISLETTKG